jgi:hypothetical protein
MAFIEVKREDNMFLTNLNLFVLGFLVIAASGCTSKNQNINNNFLGTDSLGIKNMAFNPGILTVLGKTVTSKKK